MLLVQADDFHDVRIRDSGVGMSPSTDSPGAGLGLSLMAHAASRCVITRRPATVELLCKPVVIDVERMAWEFRARLRDAGGSVDTPDATAVWRAFVAFARVPVELGGVAPAMTEDFLMFDHSHGDGLPAVLSLERKVGLADADGDYVDSRYFECSLLYDDHPDIDALPTGSLWSSSPPQHPLVAVESFVEKVEASDAFRVLVRERQPTRIDMSW